LSNKKSEIADGFKQIEEYTKQPHIINTNNIELMKNIVKTKQRPDFTLTKSALQRSKLIISEMERVVNSYDQSLKYQDQLMLKSNEGNIRTERKRRREEEQQNSSKFLVLEALDNDGLSDEETLLAIKDK